MDINDNGPEPNIFDIDVATRDNGNYRTVAWTGKYLQVTLMSIPVGESIGLEAHPETDQFLRIEAGRGLVMMGSAAENLPVQKDVSEGWSIQVPAGTWHDVRNTGDEPLRLYTVYAPVHHAAGVVQATRSDAERDEESGADKPPVWSAEPETTAADKHA